MPSADTTYPAPQSSPATTLSGTFYGPVQVITQTGSGTQQTSFNPVHISQSAEQKSPGDHKFESLPELKSGYVQSCSRIELFQGGDDQEEKHGFLPMDRAFVQLAIVRRE